MTSVLHVKRDGPILRLLLDDQATRNSLSEHMMAEIKVALDVASDDQSIAVIVIAAEGPVFCSGHNLKQLTSHRGDADKGMGYFEKIFRACSATMVQIAHHRCTIIAEVNGLASAAGCQLVASCDLAYASPDASFCTPGVNIGLFCSTPMVPLSRTIASKHALEMLLTGDVYDADHAERIGLVNKVEPADKLRLHVNQLAGRIAAKSQTAIRYGKRSFHDQMRMPLEEAYSYASGIMVKNMLDGAACEGLDAFLNKRAPHWPAN
jgi:enoyl-CoA hydratase/carnithine racemase